jgi:hypothetical protein
MDQLSNQVEHSFLPAQPIETHGETSLSSGQTSPRRLNSAFVEWLMGFPEGWLSSAALTNSGPQGMESYLSAARSRLSFLLKGR